MPAEALTFERQLSAATRRRPRRSACGYKKAGCDFTSVPSASSLAGDAQARLDLAVQPGAAPTTRSTRSHRARRCSRADLHQLPWPEVRLARPPGRHVDADDRRRDAGREPARRLARPRSRSRARTAAACSTRTRHGGVSRRRLGRALRVVDGPRRHAARDSRRRSSTSSAQRRCWASRARTAYSATASSANMLAIAQSLCAQTLGRTRHRGASTFDVAAGRDQPRTPRARHRARSSDERRRRVLDAGCAASTTRRLCRVLPLTGSGFSLTYAGNLDDARRVGLVLRRPPIPPRRGSAISAAASRTACPQDNFAPWCIKRPPTQPRRRSSMRLQAARSQRSAADLPAGLADRRQQVRRRAIRALGHARGDERRLGGVPVPRSTRARRARAARGRSPRTTIAKS